MQPRSMLGYTTRPLRPSDAEAFTSYPIDRPMLGITLVGADGEILAIGGVVFDDDVNWAFGEVAPGVERSGMILARLVKRWLRLFVALGGGDNLWALRETGEPTSLNFLPRMGFEPGRYEDLPHAVRYMATVTGKEAWRYVGA